MSNNGYNSTDEKYSEYAEQFGNVKFQKVGKGGGAPKFKGGGGKKKFKPRDYQRQQCRRDAW